MNFSIILAIDSKNGIGKSNNLPWYIPNDLKHFRNITTYTKWCYQKNVVIMGRKTWDSIPNIYKPLNNRINIIISNTITNNNNNYFVVKSLDRAFELTKDFHDVYKIFIIGGKSLYTETFNNPYCQEIYLTRVFFDFNCNTIIDNFNLDNFDLIESSDKLQNNNYFYQFETYKRKQHEELGYINLLKHLINQNQSRQTRNAEVYSSFGHKLEFNLTNHFPLLTSKKVFFRGVVEELLFFLNGQTNSKILEKKGINIWKFNTSREFLDSINLNHFQEGDMGAMYGFQWLHYNADYTNCNEDYTNKGFNQLEYCLDLLINDPTSRRILMTTYNPTSIGVLKPCHGIVIQFYTKTDNNINYLDCAMYQRSCDICCGLPFNIASYSLLVYLITEVLNNKSKSVWKPGKLTIFLGDTHIYKEHIPNAIKQCDVTLHDFPSLNFNKKITNLTDFCYEDINLINYKSGPNIKYKMFA